MLPLIIAAIGGYFIADGLSEVEFAKGGIVDIIDEDKEYRYYPNSSIEKEILDKVKAQLEGCELVGGFYIEQWKKDGYLYSLSEYEEKLLKNVKLKEDEMIFIYITRTTAIGGYAPFIKINFKKMLAYTLVDTEDEKFEFVKKGMKLRWLNLFGSYLKKVKRLNSNDEVKAYIYSPEKKYKYDSSFAKGGKVKKLYAVLRNPMGEIIADVEVDNEDRAEALRKFREMGIEAVGSISFTNNQPYYYKDGGIPEGKYTIKYMKPFTSSYIDFKSVDDKDQAIKEAKELFKDKDSEVEVVDESGEVVFDIYKDGGKVKGKWIQDAIKHKGALRKTAKKQGLIKGDEKLSMTDIKKLEKEGGKTAKRAYLAETLKKMNK